MVFPFPKIRFLSQVKLVTYGEKKSHEISRQISFQLKPKYLLQMKLILFTWNWALDRKFRAKNEHHSAGKNRFRSKVSHQKADLYTLNIRFVALKMDLNLKNSIQKANWDPTKIFAKLQCTFYLIKKMNTFHIACSSIRLRYRFFYADICKY